MPAEGRRALVTGGTGFVGSHAVDALLAAGYHVRCTVRPTSRLRWLEGKPVELVEADLSQADMLREAVRGVDVVVHCAGLTRGSRAALFAANHQGTVALLDACLASGGLRRFVLCSSQAAAGPSAPDRPRVEDDAPAPSSDYGRSKLAAERAVLNRAGRLEAVVLRPAAVYGPRDEDTLPYFRMARRGVLAVPGWRRRLVQVVHAGDVARALVSGAGATQAAGRTYFVAHPEVLSWAELAGRIGWAVGHRVVPLRVPSPLLRLAGAAAEVIGRGRRPGQIDRRRARDLSERAWTCRVDRVMAELGWSPEYGIDKGLRDTANWYREQGWL